MSSLTITLIVIVALIVVLGVGSYFVADYFFRFTILRKPTATLDHNINANTKWEPHLEFIRGRKAWLAEQKLEDVYIKSDDGLKLHGTVIRCENSKMCVICFHGYTSRGLNDYGSMAKFYNEQGFNLILIDTRNHGESEGKYTGFGVLDRFDAVKWIEFAIKTFGDDVKIFLHGDSMGGATVLMTSGLDLPDNVKAIIADCAFTSAYEVFCHVLKRDYHIPKFPIMNISEMITKKKDVAKAVAALENAKIKNLCSILGIEVFEM